MIYLPQNTLSNLDLEDKLKDVKDFRGIFSHNNLPKKMNKEEFSIINLDNSSGGGTHWVLLVNRENEKFVHYFDSFGIAPSNRIAKYLKTSKKKILFNDQQLQQEISNRCGFFCLFIIKQMAEKGLTFLQAVYELKQKPSTFNEELVKKS